MSKTILLLYTDRYYLVQHVYPYGLDILADHLRRHGHKAVVAVPWLPDADPASNITALLDEIQPDIVGLGLRNIDTTMSCEEYGDLESEEWGTFHFLPDAADMAHTVRQHTPGLPIIIGGGAFSIAPQAILDTVEADFGIVGEGETPLLQFVDAWPDASALSHIPGLVHRREGTIIVNPKADFAFPASSAHERDPAFAHAYEQTGLPVRVKRGCNQACSYCVEPIIEGRGFIHRRVEDVIAEITALGEAWPNARKIFFTDTEFNLPDEDYAASLVQAILRAELHERFLFATQLLPRPFSRGFAELLKQAGFSLILSCESFADAVLEQNGMSYRSADMIDAVRTCEDLGIDTTVDLIFGLPGETFETVDHTLAMMAKWEVNTIRRYEYTFGGRIYPGTPLCRYVDENAQAAAHIYGSAADHRLDPVWYCAPLPPKQLKEYVDARFAHPVSFANRIDEGKRQALAVLYLADLGRTNQAAGMFLDADPQAMARCFDPLFRRLSEAGAYPAARAVIETLLQTAQEHPEEQSLAEAAGIARFYLGFMG